MPLATIKDVARLAGVSITTASHVANEPRHVSDELRARVLAAMEELNIQKGVQVWWTLSSLAA